jgi:maleate isomerase
MALPPTDGSVTAHVAHFRMVMVSDTAESTRQFALQPMAEAGFMLADIRPRAILWGGTAASWLGFDNDDRFREAVTARTSIPCFGTVQIISEILARRGVQRNDLVTPYVATLEAAIIANYAANGGTSPTMCSWPAARQTTSPA